MAAADANVALGAGPSVATTQSSIREPASQPATQMSFTKGDKATAGLKGLGYLHNRVNLPSRGNNDGDDNDRADVNLGWKLVASILVILVLGAIGMVVVRRVLPAMKIRPGGSIKVVETAYLTPRKVLHLVSVGSQTFLVGGNRDGVTVITEVSSCRDQTENPSLDGEEVAS